jgi:hypothetical protein
VLVEKETEISEDDPKLLPSIAVLEFAKQIPTELILEAADIQHKYRQKLG